MNDSSLSDQENYSFLKLPKAKRDQNSGQKIQCVPEKRKTHKSCSFSENCNNLSEKVYIVTNAVYLLSFDTSYKMDWPCMTKHEPFKMVMSKFIFAEWEFKGLTGSATFQNKGTCFVSFVMFLLLRLLDSSLNLVISTQHHHSAQIDFDMHEFKLVLFIHALRYHNVFGIEWKKRKCPR